MKKLYYSLIILLVVVVGVVLPRTKAAGTFDYSSSHIGYIDSYVENSVGDIVGAYVYITDSSQSDIMYDVGYYFNLQYFQPDITSYGYDLIGKPLIWNLFDDRGASQVGAWWLLIDYQQLLEDIADKYYEGYYEGLFDGYNEGMDDGYDWGYYEGLEDGYSIGYEEGEQVGYSNGYYEGHDHGYDFGYSLGYDDGFDDGYRDGRGDGREEVLNSIGVIDREILFQDVVLPNGVKDEIIDNEILVDRVGVKIFDGSESEWLIDDIKTETILFYYDVVLSAVRSNLTLNNSITNFFPLTNNIYGSDYECHVISTTLRFNLRILKNRLSGYQEDWTDTEKVNAFKQWLAEQKEAGNPLMVWYQYVEPVEYDLVSLLRNEDGSFKDGYAEGYNNGRVDVQKENKSLLSVIPTTIGAVWLMISDFLSFEVFGLNLWSIIIVFASFSLLVLIIKMVI